MLAIEETSAGNNLQTGLYYEDGRDCRIYLEKGLVEARIRVRQGVCYGQGNCLKDDHEKSYDLDEVAFTDNVA